MANAKTGLATFGEADSFGKFPKVVTVDNIVAVFGTNAADKELAPCYPVGYNATTGKYAPWMAPDPTVLVVTLTSAASGNWTVTANGVTTANIAYNASAAAVVEAIRLIGHAVTVAKDSAVYTITFGAEADVIGLPTVSGTVSGITGGSPTAVATAGTSTYGTHKVQGFVFPNTITLDDTNTTQGVVMVKGEIDISEATALVDSGDVAALTAACKAQTLGAGIKVLGIANINKEL